MNVSMSPKMAAFAQLRMREESLFYTLFHHQQPPAGALPATITYFNNAAGQTDQFGAQVTAEDTNMEVASQLSAPNRMLVTNISCAINPSTTANTPLSAASSQSVADDIYQVTMRGQFIFTILVKPYLKLSPLGLLPASYGVTGGLAASVIAAAPASLTPSFMTNGSPVEPGYKVILPLETQTTFKAVISFDKSTVTLANALRIGILLHGVLYRPEQ